MGRQSAVGRWGWVLWTVLGVACGDAGGAQATDSASGGQTSSGGQPTTSDATATSTVTDGESLTGGATDSADTGTTADNPTEGSSTAATTTSGGCPPGSELCAGECVDTSEDPAHCGSCDLACDAGLSCVAGECVETEVCDGVDNDGDRTIDEGFADVDADGLADCVDDACEVGVVDPAAVPVDLGCKYPDLPVVEDPWNVVIEWQYKDNTQGSYTAPVIGDLTDDNMDGVVDENDYPDVAFVTLSGMLKVVEPATQIVHWTTPAANEHSPLIADIDADGSNEVVAYSGNVPVAFDGATGVKEWTGALTDSGGSGYLPVAADLDGDGLPEIVAGNAVLRGSDGTGVYTFTKPPPNYWGPVVGDLDLDGDQEIILANHVHALANDVPLWTATFVGDPGPWPMIVDADGDPEAEVVLVGNKRFGVWNHDGSQLSLTDDATIRPGPPCAGDLDGDGAVEVAWVSGLIFHAYELDGTLMWSIPIQDGSGLTGCSVFDFNGDGAYEILVADQKAFFILDGATGAIRFTDPGHESGTVWEYPTLADVDNDGSVEILFVSQGAPNYGTLTVLGHAGSGWRRGGRSWGHHEFAVTNLQPDGHVPAKPLPWWQIYNVFRGRPPADDGATDLTVTVAASCASSCDTHGSVNLLAQVANDGAITVKAGVPLTLYRKDGDQLAPVQTIVLDAPIAGGTATAGIPFTLPVTDIGADGLVLRVDDDGVGGSVQDECDEANNEAAWVSPC